MKKYIIPQIQVITFNYHQSILTGSDPKGTKLYNTGFDSSAAPLVRKSTSVWSDEDDEE
jgi:hypothetical protein